MVEVVLTTNKASLVMEGTRVMVLGMAIFWLLSMVVVAADVVHAIDDPAPEMKTARPARVLGLLGTMILGQLERWVLPQLPCLVTGLLVPGLAVLAAGGVLGVFAIRAGPVRAWARAISRRASNCGWVAEWRATVLHRGARVSPPPSSWLAEDKLRGIRSGPQPESAVNLRSGLCVGSIACVWRVVREVLLRLEGVCLSTYLFHSSHGTITTVAHPS